MIIRQSRYPIGLLVGLFVSATLLATPFCLAGGGPENVFLLVNSTSIDSMTVANHYVDLRKLPPQNVLYVDWSRSKADTQSNLFREQILQPALQAINRRQLASQIDYLVYSCAFPWRIRFQKDFPDQKFSPEFRPMGSLTGATYLWPFVMGKRKEMVSLQSNFYFSPRRNGLTMTRGFRSSYFWNPEGRRTTKDKGLPYLLSTMLGVTDGRGNSVPEIVRYLTKAAQADGTRPKGTIYYVKNNSPRSTPRHNDFPQAVADLKLAGVHGEIVPGQFIENKPQVMGVTSGWAQLKIAGAGNRYLPGALGDNLTSAGANLVTRKTKAPPQTPVSEFLRFGFAGACGTVVEPYNRPEKFPSAWLHVHYARGSSLAEAYYQSISSPYQQLIVGDPLCQPWATFSEIQLKEVADGQRLSGSIEITPSVKRGQVKLFELFIDGTKVGQCLPGKQFDLDTTRLADGYHEIRVVATDRTPIEVRSRWIGEVIVKNGFDAIELSADTERLGPSQSTVSVKVTSTGEGNVAISHQGRILASLPRGSGDALIPVDKLGKGPVTLVAVMEGEPGLRSRPLRLLIP